MLLHGLSANLRAAVAPEQLLRTEFDQCLIRSCTLVRRSETHPQVHEEPTQVPTTSHCLRFSTSVDDLWWWPLGGVIRGGGQSAEAADSSTRIAR